MTAQNAAQPSLFESTPGGENTVFGVPSRHGRENFPPASGADTSLVANGRRNESDPVAPLERGCGHWGWGAWMVSTPADDWRCPRCGCKKGRGRWKVGMHTYPFGEPCCTACARAWHDSYCERTPFG